MKIRNLIILIAVGALLTLFVYNNKFSDYIISIFNPQEPPIIEIHPIKKHIYMFIDGSGSGKYSYNVPKIDTIYLSTIIDNLFNAGGGSLWLTYVDKNASNNPVAYIKVPTKFQTPSKRKRKSGELDWQYKEYEDIYNEQYRLFKKDSLQLNYSFYQEKKQKMGEFHHILNDGYQAYKKGDWSDVVGCLNSAFRTIKSIQSDSLNQRYIIGFSDLENSVPKGTYAVLDPMPQRIKIIGVTTAKGAKNIVKDKSIEIEHPERVVDFIFTNN